jgi:hypothetical protein
MRRTYVIDVCSAHAVWPFSCGHRSSTERWCVPITVEATRAAMSVLAAIGAQEDSTE